MALIKRVFPYESDARAFVDGMVEALRTVGESAEDAIWGIEIYKDTQQEAYGIGLVHARKSDYYIVEWNVEDSRDE